MADMMDYTIKLNASPAGYNDGPCRVMNYNSKVLRYYASRDLRKLYRDMRKAGIGKHMARHHVISATTAVVTAKSLDLPRIDRTVDIVTRPSNSMYEELRRAI